MGGLGSGRPGSPGARGLCVLSPLDPRSPLLALLQPGPFPNGSSGFAGPAAGSAA